MRYDYTHARLHDILDGIEDLIDAKMAQADPRKVATLKEVLWEALCAQAGVSHVEEDDE